MLTKVLAHPAAAAAQPRVRVLPNRGTLCPLQDALTVGQSVGQVQGYGQIWSYRTVTSKHWHAHLNFNYYLNLTFT